MNIKNIIFDFGGVLIDWNPRYLYHDKFASEEEMESFLQKVCDPVWNSKLDAGYSFRQATLELSEQYPEYRQEIAIYHDQWMQMVGGAVEENVAVMLELKDRYKLFGLTNWSNETFPPVCERYSFFKSFEGIVVSGAERLIKPDPKIYQLLLSRYALKASECLFIDDNIDNIKAAQKLGFATVHLPEGVDLRASLQALDLI